MKITDNPVSFQNKTLLADINAPCLFPQGSFVILTPYFHLIL